LEFLVPQLLDEQHRSIAALEKDIHAIYDPEIRAAVSKLLEIKRHHVSEIRQMQSTTAAPVAVT
jgi:hypothetical protein